MINEGKSLDDIDYITNQPQNMTKYIMTYANIKPDDFVTSCISKSYKKIK